ncbi:MAG: ABC transporter permease subunit [Candidatus Eremiobacteraeota bacterium]|nr:ABC transporter permease subunit [Candidatus Eremiobacteraeota bacterium]
MGVGPAPTLRLDSFRERDGLVTAGAYAAGAAAASAAVAVGVALVAYGWKEVGWVLTTPGSLGVMRTLGTTALIVVIALPTVFVAGVFAAASANDPSIGSMAGKALRESLEWSSGIPPVVVGAAVFFCVMALHAQNTILTAAVALILLNLPNATARFSRAFGMVPRQTRDAAAALGASPAASFFGLLAPSAAWAIASAFLTLAAQMIGETSAITIAISASFGPEPLSVKIWHFASNRSLAGTEASACIVLVFLIGILLALSRACLRRNVESLATPQ